MFLACRSTKTIVNKSAPGPENTNHIDGAGLISKSDCFTCHKTNEKFIGPSFYDIAKRYQPVTDTVIKKLANKIIVGGPGSWGWVPMAPHPGKSQEEAITIVKFILSNY